MQRQMNLGLALHIFGGHRAAWRHPRARRGDMTNWDQHIEMAKMAEAGLLDFIFAADALSATWHDARPQDLGRDPPIRALDPLITMAALAAHTQNIGLIATVNTTYSAPPYTLARMVATADHISGGRIGWNVVTGGDQQAEAENFGGDPHPSPEWRYERATEAARVIFGLWDSWEPDAFICDRETGFYYDPAKMHVLDHHGKHFDVRGPLTTPRTPEGRPVTVQAGSSDTGRELAAEIADICFSVATTLPGAKAYYDDVKSRAAKYGRSPDEIRILPGAQLYVGRTEEEAQEKLAIMEASSDLEFSLYKLSTLFHTDLSVYPLDAPFPDFPTAFKPGTRPHLVLEVARAKGYTLRETATKYGGSLGAWALAGTPASIVDRLEEFFHGGGADGFIISAPHMPGSLEDVVTLVVPELQRRGLFRTKYEGHTLRSHLGLKPHVRKARG